MRPSSSIHAIRNFTTTAAAHTARLRVGVPFADATAVRLDEEPVDHTVVVDGDELCFDVPPRALRTVLLR
jgi:hypothetical protein